jgi:hypothetical protein
MDTTDGLSTGTRDGPVITQRMNDILRDEIQGGALANIAAATRAWSAHRRDLVLPEVTRRLATEFSGLLGTVLDLIAPVPQPDLDRHVPRTSHARSHPRAGHVDSVPVLRARRAGVPGGRAEIRTAVANDGPTSVEVGFLPSDLVAEPRGHIAAACLRFLPARLDVPPGAVADLVIDLHVPEDARPGLYHSLLHTTDRGGSPALLMFQIGLHDHQEAAVAT